VKVWRYLDLAKFVSMLETQSIFFSRMDLFNDPFEGSMPKATLKIQDEMYMERSFDSGVPAGLYAYESRNLLADERKQLFVSCWHASDTESEAMWQLYSDKQKGIAIVTDLNKLRYCLPEEVELDHVTYVDYESENIVSAPLYMYKRTAFEHEKEIRAVIKNVNSDSSGVGVDIDTNQLITRLIVSPLAQEWFFDVVRSICVKYECSFDVVKSSLSEPPTFPWSQQIEI